MPAESLQVGLVDVVATKDSNVVWFLEVSDIPSVISSIQVDLVGPVVIAVEDSNAGSFVVVGDIPGVATSFKVVWGCGGDEYVVGEGIGRRVSVGTQRSVPQQPAPKHLWVKGSSLSHNSKTFPHLSLP